MSFEEDPEVIADLQLRAATERDPSRSRTAPTWQAPETVADWPCRNAKCEKPVPVTQDAVDRLAMCNSWLRARNEREIPTDAVMVCDECKSLLDWHLIESHKRKGAQMADAIRRLKQSPAPRQEHDLIRLLTQLHHPDVSGLLESLDSKLGGKKRKAGA